MTYRFLVVSIAAVWTFSLSAAPARDDAIVISELHYHPASGDAEFIELHNTSHETVDLSGWFFSEGIYFVIPTGTVIPPRGFLVVAGNASYLKSLYGIEGVVGDFQGRLSNGGERIALRNSEGRVVDRVAYEDDDPWPENPDGLGPSLERTDFVANPML